MNHKKSLFKSQELADLLGTTIETLRYYEKIGLLHPMRGAENNYRYFTIEDVENLGITQELLKMHFSLSEIKEMLTTRTAENTLSFLHQVESSLTRQINELKSTQKSIQARIRFMQHILHETPLCQIQIQQFPTRDCIKVSDADIDEDVFAVVISEYMNKTSHSVPLVGACDFYALDMEKAKKDHKIQVCGVYYYTNDESYYHNYKLPAGSYATIAFPAGKNDSPQYSYLYQLLDFLERNHVTPESDIYSFYMISETESSQKEEHIIELQIQISNEDALHLSALLSPVQTV